MAEPAPTGSRDESRSDPGIPVPIDSVIELAHESRRYRSDGDGKRPPLRIRSVRAYWTTFWVIGSYLWLRFRARFHDDAWVEHNLRAVNSRNARRIERTIVDLQGLFIKVGQLI